MSKQMIVWIGNKGGYGKGTREENKKKSSPMLCWDHDSKYETWITDQWTNQFWPSSSNWNGSYVHPKPLGNVPGTSPRCPRRCCWGVPTVSQWSPHQPAWLQECSSEKTGASRSLDVHGCGRALYLYGAPESQEWIALDFSPLSP